MDNLTEKELKALLKQKKKKRRMKTGKKAFWAGMIMSIALIVFSAIMVVLDKDTQTVAIFAGAGVACIALLFGIYEKHSTKINLKHMEKNYIPNYDEERGLY